MAFWIACLLSFVAVLPARRLALAVDAVDRPSPSPLKIHSAPIATFGGIAVMTGLLGALVFDSTEFPVRPVTGLLLALILGMVDDARGTPPVLRLATLAGIGALIGSQHLQEDPITFFASMALVPICANAVNLLDGQDGLAAGLGALTALGLWAVFSPAGGSDAVTLGLSGALVGFLAWNRPPARIFLGNGGAYAVGAGLALAVVHRLPAPTTALLSIALCFTVFLGELVFTISRRLLANQPLTAGDRDHSYDVAARKFGRLRTFLYFLVLNGLACVVAVALRVQEKWMGAAALSAVIGSAVVGAALFARASKIASRRR